MQGNRTERGHLAIAFCSFLAGVLVAIGIGAVAQVQSNTALELGIGTASGTKAPDGIWWESAYPTMNKVSSNVWSIGVSHVFPSSFGVRADFGKLLDFSTDNVAIPNENAVAARVSGAVSCDGSNPYVCLSKWNGSGSAYGVHTGMFYDFRIGDLHLQPEAGALFYRYQFRMELAPLEPGALSGTDNNPNTGHGNSWTSYLRATVKWRGLFARLTYDSAVKGTGMLSGIQEGPLRTFIAGLEIPI